MELLFANGLEKETVDSNGYTRAYYSLAALNDNQLLFQKTAILIIDKPGEIIGQLIEDDVISFSGLSTDGTLIAYQYGGKAYNPSSNVNKSQCRVFDFKLNQVVYSIKT